VKVPVVVVCLTIACVLVRAIMVPAPMPVLAGAHSRTHHTQSAPSSGGTVYGWTTSVTRLPRALSRPAVAVGKDGRIYVFGGGTGDNHDYATTYVYSPATNRWPLDTPMPVAREGAQAVTLPDGRIAVLGGGTDCALSSLCSRGTVYDRVDVYNPATHAWARLAPMLSPRYRFAAVARAGHIYAIGGSNGTTALATIESYDAATNRWTGGAPMRVAREGARAVTLPDGRIAVLGGGIGCADNLCTTGAVYDRVDVYTPSSNRWAKLAPMPHPRYRFAAVLRDGRIYGIGGSDGAAALASTDVYNPASNSWAAAVDLPRPLEGPAAAVEANGTIDVVGGLDGSAGGVNGANAAYATLFSFDGRAWHPSPPSPQGTEDAAATLGPDGRVYVAGGFDNGWLTTVQTYDPVAERWSLGPSLPSPRCCMGMVTTRDGRVYIVGGGESKGNTLAVYRPRRRARTR